MVDILQKPPLKRNQNELAKISFLLTKNQFFLNKKLKKNEFEDLAQNLRLRTHNGMENVMEYGDHGDEFFILIRGLVSIQIVNKNIKNWAVQKKDH